MVLPCSARVVVFEWRSHDFLSRLRWVGCIRPSYGPTRLKNGSSQAPADTRGRTSADFRAGEKASGTHGSGKPISGFYDAVKTRKLKGPFCGLAQRNFVPYFLQLSERCHNFIMASSPLLTWGWCHPPNHPTPDFSAQHGYPSAEDLLPPHRCHGQTTGLSWGQQAWSDLPSKDQQPFFPLSNMEVERGLPQKDSGLPKPSGQLLGPPPERNGVSTHRTPKKTRHLETCRSLEGIAFSLSSLD